MEKMGGNIKRALVVGILHDQNKLEFLVPHVTFTCDVDFYFTYRPRTRRDEEARHGVYLLVQNRFYNVKQIVERNLKEYFQQRDTLGVSDVLLQNGTPPPLPKRYDFVIRQRVVCHPPLTFEWNTEKAKREFRQLVIDTVSDAMERCFGPYRELVSYVVEVRNVNVVLSGEISFVITDVDPQTLTKVWKTIKGKSEVEKPDEEIGVEMVRFSGDEGRNKLIMTLYFFSLLEPNVKRLLEEVPFDEVVVYFTTMPEIF